MGQLQETSVAFGILWYSPLAFTGTTASVKVAGEDFSFSESYIEGDKLMPVALLRLA